MQSNVVQTLIHCVFLHGVRRVIFLQQTLSRRNYKGRFFIQIQLKLMIKTSKNIVRLVCPFQIIPLHLNHRVSTVLLWHTNLWLFWSCCLIFNHPLMPIRVWQLLLPNQVNIVILWLMVRIRLSNVQYNLYHLLPFHIEGLCLSWNDYIYWTYFTCSSGSNVQFLRGEAFSYIIGFLLILIKNWPLSFE